MGVQFIWNHFLESLKGVAIHVRRPIMEVSTLPLMHRCLRFLLLQSMVRAFQVPAFFAEVF